MPKTLTIVRTMASNGSDPSGTKSVVITGGASGLGLAMTRHFASQGHRVAVLDVNAESGSAAVTKVSLEYPQATVVFHKCDVSSWDSQASAFKTVYQEAGKIDIVMANAGISEQGASSLAAVDDGEPSQPRLRTLDVNLTGAIYSTFRVGFIGQPRREAHSKYSCETLHALYAEE